MTAANDINLREEKAEDYRKVEEVTREAFWNHYSEGCDRSEERRVGKECTG